jgi:hypothetical protein
MSNVTFEFMPYQPFLDQAQQPARLLTAPLNEIWHVAATMVAVNPSDQPTQWAYTTGGTIRIPLFPYRVSAAEPEAAWAAAMQLASCAIIDKVAAIDKLAGGVRAHWVIGTPFKPTEDGQEVVCWMGFALVQQR